MICYKYPSNSHCSVFSHESCDSPLSMSFSSKSLFPRTILVTILGLMAKAYEEIIFRLFNQKLVLRYSNTDWILSSFLFDKSIKLYKVVIIFVSNSLFARANNLTLYFDKKLYD